MDAKHGINRGGTQGTMPGVSDQREKDLKRAFSEDPGLSEQLFDLLDSVFPGVREVAQNARALGASWESVSIARPLQAKPTIVRESRFAVLPLCCRLHL